MNEQLKRLFVFEFRRQWNLLYLIATVALGLIVYMLTLQSSRWWSTFNINRQTTWSCLDFAIPILTGFFSAGMVAFDIKDGWLRTLLIRPVLRQHYLLVRMTSVLSISIIASLIAGTIPVGIASYVAGKPIDWDLVRLAEIYVMLLGQSILLVAILAFLSCWVPGIFNVVILFLWFLMAEMFDSYATLKFWDNKWVTLAKDYLFPNGFTNSARSIVNEYPFPWADFLWGLGAATAFLALAFWSINRIEVDSTSE